MKGGFFAGKFIIHLRKLIPLFNISPRTLTSPKTEWVRPGDLDIFRKPGTVQVAEDSV